MDSSSAVSAGLVADGSSGGGGVGGAVLVCFGLLLPPLVPVGFFDDFSGAAAFSFSRSRFCLALSYRKKGKQHKRDNKTLIVSYIHTLAFNSGIWQI